MNKIFVILCPLFAVFTAAAAPLLEVFEFGSSSPVIRMELNEAAGTFSGKKWSGKVLRSGSKLTVWHLSFSSKEHDEPVRLAVKLSVPLKFKAACAWNGVRELTPEKLPHTRKSELDCFPLITAENGNQGHALGIAPPTVLSYFERTITAETLSMTARIVVDDRRLQELSFVEYPFTPEFSWRNAVEDYYGEFPRWFEPDPMVDKRIYGVGGYINHGHLQRYFEPHAHRFTGLEWEWTYAPWCEAGFWFPTGSGWVNEKYEYLNYYGIRKGKWVTKDEYYDVLKKKIASGNRFAGMFYYLLVKDIHENLADKYPDSVRGASGLPSLTSNVGHTKAVFAPGSAIFEVLKNELKQVVEHFEVSGFSFDMANCSGHFSVPSQLEYARGRAWYDDGRIYTSETVIPIPFSEYIHTLKRDGKRMGTVFNAALSDFSPVTFWFCDAAIMEGLPDDNIVMMQTLRLAMGRKPLSFWKPVEHTANTGVLWRKMQDRETRNKYFHGIAQLQLLKCYELGFSPMSRSTIYRNGDFFRPHLPVIRALKEAGYHPVHAIKNSDPLWVGRFGDDENTILTFSNPKRETISREVRVVNRYLGTEKYLFIPQYGSLEQKIINGETVFTVTLEPKAVMALRTIKVNGAVTGGVVTASDKAITLTTTGDGTFSTPAKDFYQRNVVCVEKSGSRVIYALTPECQMDISISAAGAFMTDGTFPSVEAGKEKEVQDSAFMLSVYRPHRAAAVAWRGNPRIHEPGFLDASLAVTDLTVFAPGKAPAGKKICIGTVKDFPDFKVPAGAGAFITMPDKDTLWIGGYDRVEVRRAAYAYFELLDKLRDNVEVVNFIRPVGWSINGNFFKFDRKGLLELDNDPAKPGNNWRYCWYPVRGIKGDDEIEFSVSCRVEKISGGKFQVGIYEFSDPEGRKSIRFTPVDVKAAPGWQSVTGRIKLHPETRNAKFYFLARGLGKDKIQVRSLKLNNLSKIQKEN